MTSALLQRQLERLGALQRLLLTQPPPLPASALVSSGSGGGGGGGSGSSGAGGARGARVAAGLVGLTGEARPAHDAWQAAAHIWARRARDLVAEIIAETLRSGAAGGADEAEASGARAAMAEVGHVNEVDKVDEVNEVNEVGQVSEAGAAELGSRSPPESGLAQDPRAPLPRAEAAMHTSPSEAKLDPTELEPLEAQLEALLSWARSDATTPTTPEGWTVALCLVASLPEARRAQGFLMPGYAPLATPSTTPLATRPLPAPSTTPLPPPSTTPQYRPSRYASLAGRLRAVPSSVAQLLASWGLHCALTPRWAELVTLTLTLTPPPAPKPDPSPSSNHLKVGRARHSGGGIAARGEGDSRASLLRAP